MTAGRKRADRDTGYAICGGPKRQSEGACTRPAGWGTDHPGIGRCKLHGGSTQSHRKAAEKQLAAQAVVTLGLPREVDPHQALLEELHRTAGHVAWLGAVVAELEAGDVTWGKTQHKTGGDDAGTTYAAGVNVWVQLYQQERKHLVDVAGACARAGIEERRIRLAESQGQMLASAMRAVVNALFEALVEALGSHEAALAVVREAWGRWVAEIVPRELRRLGELGEGV